MATENYQTRGTEETKIQVSDFETQLKARMQTFLADGALAEAVSKGTLGDELRRIFLQVEKPEDLVGGRAPPTVAHPNWYYHISRNIKPYMHTIQRKMTSEGLDVPGRLDYVKREFDALESHARYFGVTWPMIRGRNADSSA